jgi:RES domain-containing protein
MHNRRYAADDPGGARRVSGRYNLGVDQFPEGRAFGALYLALAPETCLGEIVRHVEPVGLARLNAYRMSELFVAAGRVLDCRDPDGLGLSPEDLVDDFDLSATRAMGEAACAAGAEGILVVSATGLGDNLVLFPENMRAGSRLEVLSARDPRLYVDRSGGPSATG